MSDDYKIGDIVTIKVRIKLNRILPEPIDIKARLHRPIGSRSFICIALEDGESFVRNTSQMVLVSRTINLEEIYNA